MTRTVSNRIVSNRTVSAPGPAGLAIAPVRAARAALLGMLALAAPLAVATPAAAGGGYHVDRYAFVQGVDVYDHLNMRRWPAAHSQKIGAIPHHGDGFYVQRCIVRPHGSSSDWCKVHYAGKWGWVSKRFLGLY